MFGLDLAAFRIKGRRAGEIDEAVGNGDGMRHPTFAIALEIGRNGLYPHAFDHGRSSRLCRCFQSEIGEVVRKAQKIVICNTDPTHALEHFYQRALPTWFPVPNGLPQPVGSKRTAAVPAQRSFCLSVPFEG